MSFLAGLGEVLFGGNLLNIEKTISLNKILLNYYRKILIYQNNDE